MGNKSFTKTFVFLLLALLLPAACSKTENPKVDHAKYILQNDQLTAPLKKLLEVTDIEHDGTLGSVVQATQKAWLRKPGTERWHMDNRWEGLYDEVMPLFDQLGVLNDVTPFQNEYDYTLVLGALVSRVRQRLAYALELWKQGARFGTLVFLVGARPLDPEKESAQELFDRTNQFLPIRTDWQAPGQLPQTEADMARMVFDQAKLPEGFKESVNIVFVDTPMQPTLDGNIRRPNTADTIIHWLASDVKPGSILAISNQPYVGYQHAALKLHIPQNFTIETVGPAASPKLHVGVLLDNIARWLYMENKLQQCS